MTIGQDLDRLRASLPGCSVAAFGDAATRLVLRASHEDGCRREFLDELCDRAAGCFGLMDAASGIAQDGTANEAMVLSGGHAGLFLRDAAQSYEFLGLVCDRSQDPGHAFEAARNTLARIVERP